MHVGMHLQHTFACFLRLWLLAFFTLSGLAPIESLVAFPSHCFCTSGTLQRSSSMLQPLPRDISWTPTTWVWSLLSIMLWMRGPGKMLGHCTILIHFVFSLVHDAAVEISWNIYVSICSQSDGQKSHCLISWCSWWFCTSEHQCCNPSFSVDSIPMDPMGYANTRAATHGRRCATPCHVPCCALRISWSMRGYTMRTVRSRSSFAFWGDLEKWHPRRAAGRLAGRPAGRPGTIFDCNRSDLKRTEIHHTVSPWYLMIFLIYIYTVYIYI